MLSYCALLLAAASLLAPAVACCAVPATTIEGPEKDDKGILTYTVTSEYLKGENPVQILLPKKLEEGARYPVLYILPVTPGPVSEYGSGILEAWKLDVANQYGLICVYPSFDSCPWYADHPWDSQVRQESYLLKVVLPLVESKTPALAEPRGRLLIGFSKSGWGAFSLLLRHPELFGRAAAWDAPLMQPTPDRFNMADVFPSPAAFEPYRIPALLEKRAGLLRPGPPRLTLLGFGNFKVPTQQAHEKMVELGIPHNFDNSIKLPHDWHSGWFAEAVKYLMMPDPGAAPPPAKTPEPAKPSEPAKTPKPALGFSHVFPDLPSPIALPGRAW